MAESWYLIGTEWVTLHSRLAHGDVVRETAEFATRHELTANTIRGYRAATIFVDRLRKGGTIDEEQLKILTSQKLKSIAVLQRVDHRGGGHLAPLLARVLGEEPPSRKQLEETEEKLRKIDTRAAARRSGQGTTPAEANAHSFTLRATSFKAEALKAWARLHHLKEVPTMDLDFAKSIAPLTVDRVTMSTDGMHALRLVAETSEKSKVSPRLGEAFVGALAAARVFSTVLLLTQAHKDSETLGALARKFEGCGVLVALLGPKRTIITVVTDVRANVPDLVRLLPELLGQRGSIAPQPTKGAPAASRRGKRASPGGKSS